MLFSGYQSAALKSMGDSYVVVLPLGAIEQHGPHLAVGTDTDIVSQIAMEAEQKSPADILLCPTLAFGSSHHHLAFGATISISAATYTQVLVEMVGSLAQSGFRRIILLNGHGGNITPAKQALSILSNQFDANNSPNIALATYWELAAHAFTKNEVMESPALSHACEYETSLMLHLFPGKVLKNHIERSKRPDSNGYIPWEDDEPYRGVSMVKKTQFISGNGSSGEPQLATAEKGKFLFEQAIGSFLQFVSSYKKWPLMQSINSDYE